MGRERLVELPLRTRCHAWVPLRTRCHAWEQMGRAGGGRDSECVGCNEWERMGYGGFQMCRMPCMGTNGTPGSRIRRRHVMGMNGKPGVPYASMSCHGKRLGQRGVRCVGLPGNEWDTGKSGVHQILNNCDTGGPHCVGCHAWERMGQGRVPDASLSCMGMNETPRVAGASDAMHGNEWGISGSRMRRKMSCVGTNMTRAGSRMHLMGYGGSQVRRMPCMDGNEWDTGGPGSVGCLCMETNGAWEWGEVVLLPNC